MGVVKIEAITNPSNGLFNIDFSGEFGDRYYVEIANFTGRIIFKSKGKVNTGMNTINLNLNYLSKGIYTLSLQTKNIIKNTKLVFIRS
jgi:hypothetical protein